MTLSSLMMYTSRDIDKSLDNIELLQIYDSLVQKSLFDRILDSIEWKSAVVFIYSYPVILFILFIKWLFSYQFSPIWRVLFQCLFNQCQFSWLHLELRMSGILVWRAFLRWFTGFSGHHANDHNALMFDKNTIIIVKKLSLIMLYGHISAWNLQSHNESYCPILPKRSVSPVFHPQSRSDKPEFPFGPCTGAEFIHSRDFLLFQSSHLLPLCGHFKTQPYSLFGDLFYCFIYSHVISV